MTTSHGAKARRFEAALGELGKLVCGEFARLAGVPNNPAWSQAFSSSLIGIAHPLSEDADVEELFFDVQKTAVDFQEQLEKLVLHITRRFPGFNGRLTLEDGTAFYPAHVLAELSVLTDELPRARRGRHRGDKRYPGLSEFVSLLEFDARCAGGGFTAHRKLGTPKGSLVEALDRLRGLLLASAELKPLARLIPSRGKHPISLYESALGAARKEAVKHAARTGASSDARVDARAKEIAGYSP